MYYFKLFFNVMELAGNQLMCLRIFLESGPNKGGNMQS
jgi:hypothetical protein